MNVAVTKRSKNVKIGPMMCTTSTAEWCPPSCPLLNNGCYASSGFHTNMHWKKVTEGVRGLGWEDFISFLKDNLSVGQVWRHNVAGDLPGFNGELDERKCYELAWASGDAKAEGFTYTHYPMFKHNYGIVKYMNMVGFTVNVSTDNLTDAYTRWHSTSDVPIVTLVPEERWGGQKSITHEGLTVVRCPAEYAEDRNCANCRMCAEPDRSYIIGFTPHGTGKKRVDVIARDAA